MHHFWLTKKHKLTIVIAFGADCNISQQIGIILNEGHVLKCLNLHGIYLNWPFPTASYASKRMESQFTFEIQNKEKLLIIYEIFFIVDMLPSFVCRCECVGENWFWQEQGEMQVGGVSRIPGNGEFLPCTDGSTEAVTKIEGRRILGRVRFTEQSEEKHSDPPSERDGNSAAETPVQQ